VDLKEWKAEVPDIEKHFALFGNRMPARLKKQLEEMKKRLG
jgi:phosphoenolpyruvate carboxykinase (GTP)